MIMFSDIYILYLLSKYKMGFLSKKDLLIEVREYVKAKGQVFIKLVQLFLIQQYQWENEFTLEEFEEMNKILDKVYVGIPEADFNVGCGSVAYVGYSNQEKTLVKKKLIPNIVQQINDSFSSFENMLDIAKIFNYDYINNVNIIEYKNFLLEQTKLDSEAKNMLRMRTNFVNVKNIYIPKVFSYNKDFIEMRFVKGESINSFLKKHPDKNKECMDLIKLALSVMLEKRFIHGDLHDGNLLFYISNNKVKLNLIDFGLVMELTDKQQKIIYDFIFIDKVISKIKFVYEILNKSISYLEFKELCYKDKNIKFFTKNKIDPYKLLKKLKEYSLSINIKYLNLLLSLCFIRLKLIKSSNN